MVEVNVLLGLHIVNHVVNIVNSVWPSIVISSVENGNRNYLKVLVFFFVYEFC